MLKQQKSVYNSSLVISHSPLIKVVTVGGFDHVKAVPIGGNNPIVIQTMWKDRLLPDDIEGKALRGLVDRINRLEALGCGLLRFAVPDIESAGILGRLASVVSMPLCADIHFDYKIALRCLDFPIAKLRINPGNIGKRANVEAVLAKAAKKHVPIRIGINAGSLPMDLREKATKGLCSEAMLLAAEQELAIFKEFGFTDVLISMKASEIADTLKANRLLHERTDFPLHIGLTEAGPLVPGVVRNTAALLPLLIDGIGDTIRVSLSDTAENEVIAAREILAAAAECVSDSRLKGRLEQQGAKIISCPRCGRCGFDTHAFTGRWMHKLYSLKKSISVAIMGCEVNGPVEAKNADIGITGTGNAILIFSRGKVIRKVNAAEADEAFKEELEKL